MAANMFDPKDPMVQELLRRSIAEQTAQDQMSPLLKAPATAVNPISPQLALVGGSLADSASTYSFLKRGSGDEQNPVLAPLFNGHPNHVIPAAAAGAVGYALLYKLLHKNHPKMADMLAGQVGALHSRFAGGNFGVPSGTTGHAMQSGIHTRVEHTK